MWSNFSAHNPAIIPTLPNMNEDKKVKINKVKYCWICILRIKIKITIEIIAIIKLLVTAAKEIEIVTSAAESGA